MDLENFTKVRPGFPKDVLGIQRTARETKDAQCTCRSPRVSKGCQGSLIDAQGFQRMLRETKDNRGA